MPLAFLLLAQGLSAEETFRKIEDAALTAKSFHVSSKFRCEKVGRLAIKL